MSAKLFLFRSPEWMFLLLYYSELLLCHQTLCCWMLPRAHTDTLLCCEKRRHRYVYWSAIKGSTMVNCYDNCPCMSCRARGGELADYYAPNLLVSGPHTLRLILYRHPPIVATMAPTSAAHMMSGPSCAAGVRQCRVSGRQNLFCGLHPAQVCFSLECAALNTQHRLCSLIAVDGVSPEDDPETVISRRMEGLQVPQNTLWS